MTKFSHHRRVRHCTFGNIFWGDRNGGFSGLGPAPALTSICIDILTGVHFCCDSLLRPSCQVLAAAEHTLHSRWTAARLMCLLNSGDLAEVCSMESFVFYSPDMKKSFIADPLRR